MWNRLKTWWRREGELIRLRGLDDRLLADMGLDRATLEARVRGEPRVEAAARPQAKAAQLAR